jgi:uncharacterized protein (TIGR00266 family)
MNQQPEMSTHNPQAGGAPMPAMNVQQPMAQGAGLTHQITHGPSFAMLRVDLQPGQVLISEAGSMVARHSHVGMEVKMNAGKNAGCLGGLWALCIAFIRKIIGGETFFVNHFSAPQPGSVWIAPTMSGQISHRRLVPGQKLVLSSGAYLASSGDIEVSMKFGGLSSILAKEGAFMLEVSGNGDLWFTSYGGIQAIDINGPYMVDNGHLVGYEGQLTMSVRSAGGGMLGMLASGEGLVCEFNGQGRIYIQSRNLSSLVGWLTPLMPG